MGRRLRLQYPGAIYHVSNRGRGGASVFPTPERAKAFAAGLEETCQRLGWQLQAFALVPSGYHLVIQTPQPNLVDGMRWLQGTYATRLSRMGATAGAVFDGRYRSVLLEPSAALAETVDLVHLLPWIEQVVAPDQLAMFRWGSLRAFLQKPRAAGLRCEAWLALHGLRDRRDGWDEYLRRLESRLKGGRERLSAHLAQVSRGWLRGSAEWRRARADDYARMKAAPHPSEPRSQAALRVAGWERRLAELLAKAHRTKAQLAAAPKSAAWKVALAAELRTQSGATNAWIASALHMGAPGAVSRYVGEWKSGLRRE